MSNWVTYEVLSEPRNDARAKLIQKFARIAVVRKTPRIRTHAHTQRHTQHDTHEVVAERDMSNRNADS
jgi:hypothetical protein